MAKERALLKFDDGTNCKKFKNYKTCWANGSCPR